MLLLLMLRVAVKYISLAVKVQATQRQAKQVKDYCFAVAANQEQLDVCT